jgi:hypothetical protein
MPSLVATTTQTATVKLAPKLKAKLVAALHTYVIAKKQIKGLEETADSARADVETLLDQAGETNLKIDGYTTTLCAPVRSVLDVALLLAEGVSKETIDKCTRQVPTKAYVKITGPKEDQ